MSDLCDLVSCRPQLARPRCPWDFPGKQTGVGCYALPQGIFLTQRSNPSLLHLLHWQGGSLPLVPPGKPPSMNTQRLLRTILHIAGHLAAPFGPLNSSNVPSRETSPQFTKFHHGLMHCLSKATPLSHMASQSQNV